MRVFLWLFCCGKGGRRGEKGKKKIVSEWIGMDRNIWIGIICRNSSELTSEYLGINIAGPWYAQHVMSSINFSLSNFNAQLLQNRLSFHRPLRHYNCTGDSYHEIQSY